MASVEDDVTVEEHQYGEGPRHTMDLYRPAAAATKQRMEEAAVRPVVWVVWVHGGAWVDRSKAEFAGLGRGLVRAGGGALSVAVVNYELSPRALPPAHVFPAHVRDIVRALSWLWEHEQEAAGVQRPVELWVCGHSAGAHMAGTLALDPSYFTFAHRCTGSNHNNWGPPKVTGWIGIAGIYDIVRLHADFPSYKMHFLDYAFGQDEGKWKDASPQFRCPPAGQYSTAPWLVCHSEQDELVNTVQSQAWAAHLNSLDIPVRSHIDSQGGKHWDGVHSLTRPDSPLALLITRFVLGK